MSSQTAAAFETASEALRRLRHWVEERNWAGFDPYDALNSPVLRAATLGLKYPRIAVIQFMKKSPIDLRRWLFVRPGHNPKGLGLFLWGYAKLFRATGDRTSLDRVDELLSLLRAAIPTKYSGSCWGYNFDWQSRAFFVPKGTPTIVNTSFVGHALIDAYEWCGNDQALEIVSSVPSFLLRDLNRTPDGDDFCFSYTPLDRIAVHNANLLGASLLIRLQRYVPDDEARQAALAALAYSMRHQRPDGSWWYAEPEYQHWIDSFHTGFNLQSIDYILREGEGLQYRPAYERGVTYYASEFFLEDGTAKYYHDRTDPIDIHSYAQAIVFFSRLGGDHAELATRIMLKMVEDMTDPSGYLLYRRQGNRTNRIPYMRWSQAWGFHALSEYVMSFMSERADSPAGSVDHG